MGLQRRLEELFQWAVGWLRHEPLRCHHGVTKVDSTRMRTRGFGVLVIMTHVDVMLFWRELRLLGHLTNLLLRAGRRRLFAT